MNKITIYGVQVLLALAIITGVLKLNLQHALIQVGRTLLYIFFLEAVVPICEQAYKYQTAGSIDIQALIGGRRVLNYLSVFALWAALLVYNNQRPVTEEFVYTALVYLFLKFQDMAVKPSINYGVGMACSFFEGYLVHILPSDGAKFIGFEENIIKLENREGVLFPVKKLFIIITKNLYCPPDLKEFNKPSKDLAYLEAVKGLPDVQKSVAGVKDRIYRNSAYKVHRAHAAPLYLAAECATPLHTLYKVLDKRSLYGEVADIDVGGVVADFCRTLQAVLDRSPDCRGKCELVYYDNEDPSQNLADILVNRVRELAPDFEQRIIERREDNVLEMDK